MDKNDYKFPLVAQLTCSFVERNGLDVSDEDLTKISELADRIVTSVFGNETV